MFINIIGVHVINEAGWLLIFCVKSHSKYQGCFIKWVGAKYL